MTAGHPNPCRPADQHFCARMDEMLQPKGHVKGLSAFYLMGPPDYVDEFWGVVYRAKASDAGMMISLCPWCGANYIDHIEVMQKRSAERAAEKRTVAS